MDSGPSARLLLLLREKAILALSLSLSFFLCFCQKKSGGEEFFEQLQMQIAD